MGRSGLHRVVKSVRSKRGMTKRTYWVRATEAVQRHKGLLAAGLATGAVLGGLAYGNRHALHGAYTSAMRTHRLIQATGGAGGFRNHLNQMHTMGSLGWKRAAKEHGTLATNAQKVYQKTWGTEHARKVTTNKVRRGIHKALTSDLATELAEHVGTGAGALLASKMRRRSRSVVTDATVGGIVGKYATRAAVRLLAKTANVRKR